MRDCFRERAATCWTPGSSSRSALRFLLGFSASASQLCFCWQDENLELVAQPASCSLEQGLSLPGSSSHLQCKAETWSSPVTWASSCSLGCNSRRECWSRWDSVLSQHCGKPLSLLITSKNIDTTAGYFWGAGKARLVCVLLCACFMQARLPPCWEAY